METTVLSATLLINPSLAKQAAGASWPGTGSSAFLSQHMLRARYIPCQQAHGPLPFGFLVDAKLQKVPTPRESPKDSVFPPLLQG